MGEETPEEFNPEEAMKQLFESLENPVQEAFVGFHEMYKGLLSGGFSKYEALMILGVALHQTMSSTDGDESEWQCLRAYRRLLRRRTLLVS